jgi:hypothetical protein
MQLIHIDIVMTSLTFVMCREMMRRRIAEIYDDQRIPITTSRHIVYRLSILRCRDRFFTLLVVNFHDTTTLRRLAMSQAAMLRLRNVCVKSHVS